MVRAHPARPGMMCAMSIPLARVRAPSGPRLAALAGVLLVALNLRIAVAAISPVLDVVRGDVPVSDVQAGVLGALPPLSFAVFGALTPAVARRWGLERSVVAAMALTVLGELCRSLATSPTSLLGWSVVAFAG